MAVDGHAGSGKTTLAGLLSEALGAAPVVHLDDLASHESFFGWEERLRRQVLLPFSRGESADHQVYDWAVHSFAGTRTLPPAPVVFLEGVGAGRRAVRGQLACLLWMDLPRQIAWRRGRSRDGPELAGFWEEWTRAEERHFRADPSRPYADWLLRPYPEHGPGPGREHPHYELRPQHTRAGEPGGRNGTRELPLD